MLHLELYLSVKVYHSLELKGCHCQRNLLGGITLREIALSGG